MAKDPKLMSISKGSGCGCKIQPAVLHEMLGEIQVQGFDAIIVARDKKGEGK